MTFGDALKRLAEKEPDKFRVGTSNSITYNGSPDYFEWLKDEWEFAWIEDEAWSQDSIDEILALIGWEFWVTPIDFEELVGTWTYHIRHCKSHPYNFMI